MYYRLGVGLNKSSEFRLDNIRTYTVGSYSGADEILFPEKQLAKWAAIRYGSNHLLDYIELDEEHAIYEVSVPDNWCNKSIGEINIRQKYNISIMAIKRNGEIKMTLTPDTILTSDITLLVLGEYEVLKKCFHI